MQGPGIAKSVNKTSKTQLDALDNEEEAGSDSEDQTKAPAEEKGALEPALEEMWRADYRLLIAACRLLLLSHNAAVVVAVAQLFYHCAPKEEMPGVVKALMRILRSTKSACDCLFC